MTNRIATVTGFPVVVTVCSDTDGHPDRSEQAFLGVRCTRGRVREVVLSAGGVAVLVARTVFISRHLLSNQALRKLGQRSLGELLFSQGDARWLRREFAPLNPQLSVWPRLKANMPCLPNGAWARRTIYLLDAAPICVTEVILPSLFK
jgi:chorismate--pyruvate lyase